MNHSSFPTARTDSNSLRYPGLWNSSTSSSCPQPLPEKTPAYSSIGVTYRFGDRLRELRKSRNMTQLRMAVDFGIDRSFISDVERGKKSISLDFLEVIALGLDVSLSDLLNGI